MTEDGPSVPKTPPSTRAPLPPDPIHDITKGLAERAALLEGRPAIARVVLFQSLVSEMPMRKDMEPPDTPSLSEMFRAAFDDATGHEFWRLRLQMPMGPNQFAEMLATFLTLEGGDKAVHKNAIGAVLVRDLTTAGKVPSITETVDAPIVDYVDPSTGQRRTYTMPAAIRLVGDDFFAIEPLRWMAERETYHIRLPASLISYLAEEPKREPVKAAPSLSVQASFQNSDGNQARTRGRKPVVLNGVVLAMRAAIACGKYTAQILMDATEDSLVADFGTSRHTCRSARSLVLSEIVPNSEKSN